MLRVSPLQLRLLGAAARKRFESESVVLLRTEFPEATAPHSDDVLRQFIRAGMARARDHGISAVTDVERWLRLMVRLGPKFDADPRYPSIRAILDVRDTPPKQRRDLLDATAAQFGEQHK